VNADENDVGLRIVKAGNALDLFGRVYTCAVIFILIELYHKSAKPNPLIHFEKVIIAFLDAQVRPIRMYEKQKPFHNFY
jgi:hypothetical protein